MTDQQLQNIECYSNTSDQAALGFMADIALSALSSGFTPPDLDDSAELSVGGRSELAKEMAISSIICINGNESVSISLNAAGDNAPAQKRDTTPKFNG